MSISKKNLTTVFLFIFWAMTVAILVAGLVFYQEVKNNSTSQNQSSNNSKTPSVSNSSVSKGTVLNMAEVAKHNKKSDCWLVINGKVYDITKYFGSHPGGNSTMTPTCGENATSAYKTRDPYATSSPSYTAHSSYAQSLLNKYYIGALGGVVK